MRKINIVYEITLSSDYEMELTDEQYAALESGKLNIDDIDPDLFEYLHDRTYDMDISTSDYRIYSEDYDKQIR